MSSNDNDRPTPSRPFPASEPTLPSARKPSDPAIRAAGLVRPQAKTDPSIANEKLREYEEQRRREMIVRHDEEIRELRDANKAQQRHAEKVEKALGLVDEEPDAKSDPPPATDTRRKPRNKVEAIALDSLIAKYGVYVLFACWAAQQVATYFHLLPGAK